MLYQLLIKTLLLWLGGVMLYGLLALWVLVQHARLAQHGAQAPVITDSAEGSIVRRRVLDIASIGGQTRQMLNMLITLVFVIGLYWIWHGAVPALEVVGDFELWRYADTVDGEKMTWSLTLGSLFLALAVVTVTLIAARNIGGLLDAMLLERLALQPDANYAIKTVTRYAIAGVGIVTAANLFGISWSRAQWLVAALGVGLGFGLQEIVANFVSGLIVLAERPIRVGDTVTVGEVTGTVGRIRARATLITDFDNKEVLIPNKAFITERVVNWTLSSQVTRVLIKLGVAYGTDTMRAQEVIIAALQSSGRWRLGLALSLVTVFLWGILPIALSITLQALDVYTVIWFRFLASFTLLAIYLGVTGKLPSIVQLRSASKKLLAIATIFLGMNYLMFTQGLALTGPAHAEVLIQLSSVLLSFGGLVIFKERYILRQWVGVGVLTLGFVLFFHAQLTNLITAYSKYLLGSGFLVAGAMAWAYLCFGAKAAVAIFIFF